MTVNMVTLPEPQSGVNHLKHDYTQKQRFRYSAIYQTIKGYPKVLICRLCF